MNRATNKLSLTEWKFLQLPGGTHQSNGINFQVLELDSGFLYKWENGGKWYAAKLASKKAAWVLHKLVEGHHLHWACEDKVELL